MQALPSTVSTDVTQGDTQLPELQVSQVDPAQLQKILANTVLLYSSTVGEWVPGLIVDYAVTVDDENNTPDQQTLGEFRLFYQVSQHGSRKFRKRWIYENSECVQYYADLAPSLRGRLYQPALTLFLLLIGCNYFHSAIPWKLSYMMNISSDTVSRLYRAVSPSQLTFEVHGTDKRLALKDGDNKEVQKPSLTEEASVVFALDDADNVTINEVHALLPAQDILSYCSVTYPSSNRDGCVQRVLPAQLEEPVNDPICSCSCGEFKAAVAAEPGPWLRGMLGKFKPLSNSNLNCEERSSGPTWEDAREASDLRPPGSWRSSVVRSFNSAVGDVSTRLSTDFPRFIGST